MIGGLIKTFLTVAGIGGVTALGASHLNEEAEKENKKVSDIVVEKADNLVKEAKTFSDQVQKDPNLGKTIFNKLADAGDTIRKKSDAFLNPIDTAEEKVEEKLTDLGLGDLFNKDGESSWWKWLLGGGTAFGGWKLLSSMFGKDDKSNNDDGFGFAGLALTLSIVVGAVAFAMNYDTIEEKVGNTYADLTDTKKKSNEPSFGNPDGLDMG